MSIENKASSHSVIGPSLLLVLLNVIVFAALGPFIAGLIFAVGFSVVEGIAHLDPAGGFAMIPVLALFVSTVGLKLEYTTGILPASLAGLMIGLLSVFRPNSRPFTIVLVGLFVGLLFLLIGGQLKPSPPELAKWIAPALILLFVSTCIGATFCCWRISRWILPRRLQKARHES
jgi:Sodium/hydrogen exchanger family